KYGILDADDLAAWRKVREPLEDNGFAIVRQLGMGQFGRVYEAINTSNGAMPARVAVKVDRIRKGHKKEVIQAVETIMDISRDLAESPHIIRVYDAGRLKPLGFTYHVLQLVDGDTLDNLIGVTGEEHSSVLRPQVARTDLQHLRADYLKAIHHGGDEAWRRERVSLPFVDPLSLPQALDVLTSTLLWLEETHALGYAVNDLKNGNLMISRRGQFKAIDLDAFSPIQSTLDMLPDYFFLAVTLLLFVLRVMDGGKDSKLKAQGLLTDPAALHKTLTRLWRFGDLAELTDGRVHSSEVIEWMVSCMDRCRNGSFAHDPKAFSACIDQLIHIKRRLTQEEMILD
ncbi:MAG: serine/threonine protein kinase, partial [Kiritimatiellia bacterium]